MLYLQLQNPLEKRTPTVFEMPQLLDNKKTDSREKMSCLKCTLYIGRNICINIKIDRQAEFCRAPFSKRFAPQG